MIYMIASCNEENIIGWKGAHKLPWKQKADMERFKRFTEHSIVVMGYNTAESLNWKPLKNRINVFLGEGNTNKAFAPGWLWMKAVEKCVKNFNSFWVIGGASTYESFLPHVSKIYLTRVFSGLINTDHSKGFKDLALFPTLEAPEWCKQHETGTFKADKDNEYPYRYETWVRGWTPKGNHST
jgi:dihydrofolate reductase